MYVVADEDIIQEYTRHIWEEDDATEENTDKYLNITNNNALRDFSDGRLKENRLTDRTRDIAQYVLVRINVHLASLRV